ncbi:zf-CCHC domain-containing protein [Tanacetum coccineum]
MSSITAQQIKLDLELVPKEKILEIGKCNRRLNPRKIQRGPTFQVVLDALALTPCYSIFLITVDVPEVYMHQFWDSVYKHDTLYIFKMDKRKRFKLNLEIFKDIFKICPRVQGQDFDALPTDEEIMYFLRDLGHTGKSIHSMMLAQILWGMYHQKNVDYVELLWENFIYQIDNKAYKKQEKIAKVTAIEESKDLTSLSLDELIRNLKVYEMIIKKDSKIVKAKGEMKSLALKAKKESSEEKFVRQPRNDKKTFQRSHDDKNGKSDRKCFRCGDPNHLIGECPKPPKDKNQRAFVGGCWSDSGEEDDEKVNNKTCLVAQASSEVCSESSYFSDEILSIDDLVLDNEYDKLRKMSLKIITKNKRLKATRDNLENKISILKEKVPTLEKNKEVDLECVECHMLKIENEKLKEEALKLTVGT